MTHQAFMGDLKLGEAWTSGALSVWPLFGNGAGTRDYTTLGEAMASGRFHIHEVGDAGTVPELRVDNRLDRPVLLLDGEELVGAKQNRVLNLTVMVPAQSELTIPVSCVEAGRWSYNSRGFASSGRAQFARGRARKVQQVSYSLRETGKARASQADVWNEIESKASRMGIRSETGSMSDIFAAKDRDLEEMIAHAPRHEGQVGAVFGISGRIAGIELFDRPDVYALLATKILSSYAIDALDEEGMVGPNGSGEPAAFLKAVAAASGERRKAIGLGEDIRFDGVDLIGAGLEIDGVPVHFVAFAASVEGQAETPIHGFD